MFLVCVKRICSHAYFIFKAKLKAGEGKIADAADLFQRNRDGNVFMNIGNGVVNPINMGGHILAGALKRTEQGAEKGLLAAETIQFFFTGQKEKGVLQHLMQRSVSGKKAGKG